MTLTMTLDDAIRADDLAKLALPAKVYLLAAYLVWQMQATDVDPGRRPEQANDLAAVRLNWPDVAETGTLVLNGYVQ